MAPPSALKDNSGVGSSFVPTRYVLWNYSDTLMPPVRSWHCRTKSTSTAGRLNGFLPDSRSGEVAPVKDLAVSGRATGLNLHSRYTCDSSMLTVSPNC